MLKALKKKSNDKKQKEAIDILIIAMKKDIKARSKEIIEEQAQKMASETFEAITSREGVFLIGAITGFIAGALIVSAYQILLILI